MSDNIDIGKLKSLTTTTTTTTDSSASGGQSSTQNTSIWEDIGTSFALDHKFAVDNGSPDPPWFSMVSWYANAGHSKEESYNYFKKCINTSKSNPDDLKYFINSTLEIYEDHYDHNIGYGKVANNNTEVLDKIIKAKDHEQIPNAICSTIHGFIMDSLHDCKIPSALVAVEEDGVGHSTLLYQYKKGTYVWNNYEKATEIKADNIIDAVKQINKTNKSTKTRSFIMIEGSKNNEYYQEYNYTDESAFGKEIDPLNSHKDSAFKKEDIENSSVSADGGASTYGSEVNLNANFSNDKKTQQFNAEIQEKQNGETELFDKSNSFGAKGIFTKQINKGKTSKEFDGKLLYSYTNGSDSTSANETTAHLFQEKVGFSLGRRFARTSNGTEITGKARAEEEYNLAINNYNAKDIQNPPDQGEPYENLFNGEISGGLGFKNNTAENLEVSGDASFGATIASVKDNYKNQDVGFKFGAKSNIDTALTYKPTKDLSISTEGSAFYAKDSNLEHYGGDISLGADYKPSKNLDIKAGIQATNEQKDLSLGLFNEKIKDKTTLGAYGEVNTGQHLSIFGNVNHDFEEGENAFKLGAKYKF